MNVTPKRPLIVTGLVLLLSAVSVIAAEPVPGDEPGGVTATRTTTAPGDTSSVTPTSRLELALLGVRSGFDTGGEPVPPGGGAGVSVVVTIGGPRPVDPAAAARALDAAVPPAAAPPRSGDPRRMYQRLFDAARAARSGTGRDCYRTAERTARRNQGNGNGRLWPDFLKYRNKGLRDGLRAAVDEGYLLPGMVIYACLRPGSDYNSVNLSNLPHWFTYLGTDPAGVDRFADQYGISWSLEGIATEYGPRRIDTFCDPYRSR